jgi:succinate dehydrogenase / fumarate reductase cytochrome b subunit
MNSDQRYYLLRRLHSLSGVLPVGLFLVQHIYANMLAAWGPKVYQEHTNFILDQPLLPLMEWGMVFIPLAFHSLLGFYYTFNSKQNVSVYKYQRNWMYMLQRATGAIVFFYIIFHVATTTFSFSEYEKRTVYETMSNYFALWGWAFWIYCIGVVAASFHFCNGLWGFSIMWGLTITRKSQNRMFKAMMGLFVVMSLMGIVSALVLGGMFKAVDPERVKQENKEMAQEARDKHHLSPPAAKTK